VEEPAPVLVQERADEDLPRVGVQRVVPADAVPRAVQLHERRLHQVLRPVPVAAEQESGAAQGIRPGPEVLGETPVSIVHRPSDA
jgi:hypothetical protein